MHSARLATAALAFLAASAGPAPAGSASCSDSEASTAGRAVYTIGDWEGLGQFYKKYRGCDDGDVFLELSDRVSDLLANHWDTLATLKEQLGDSDSYAKFVFYHIDPTVMPERYPQILDNAKNDCPADDADLCGQIAAAATAKQ